MGQYEVAVFQKKHQAALMSENGEIHTDIVASAITEAISTTPPALSKERDITLIIPQDLFLFFRSEIPNDISSQAVTVFIQEKVRSLFSVELQNYYYDFVSQNNGQKKLLFCFLLDKKNAQQWVSVAQLLNLKIVSLLPESLSYFSLFQKTLRKDKYEYFIYASLSSSTLHGYIYDSFGPMERPRFASYHTGKDIESTLKEIVKRNIKDIPKFNRLILSGPLSETIRQDTFTKSVGVWTNPLKRIIPQFYTDYLKQLFMSGEKKPFPYLDYDVCFGAFIFQQEQKGFSVLRNAPQVQKAVRAPRAPIPIHLPMKEIVIGLISCIVSFGIFVAISKIPWGVKEQTKAVVTITPQPIESPTPTPIPVNRKQFKLKVLNGSGVRGKAAEVKDFLKSKGYEEILTGNADTFDFEKTVVALKKNSPLQAIIAADLASATTTITFDTLKDSDPADMVITFGKDWK